MPKVLTRLLLTAMVLSFSSCNSSGVKDETGSENKNVQAHYIEFTEEQLSTAEITTGKISMQLFGGVVECTGSLEVPPHAQASVSAPMAGYVQWLSFLPGDYVKKGTLLARLQHPDYIALQQNYLETSNKLEFAQLEFKRQDEMARENASSQKRMQESSAEYKTLKASLEGLSAQLRMIGINPGSLEKDGIRQTIPVNAPISGYITAVNINLGKYVDAQQPMYEITDNRHMHLELKVYEKDAAVISANQPVKFIIQGNVRDTFHASVKLINQKMDNDSRTLTIHASLEQLHASLKPGMFVNAQIFSQQTEAAVLTEDAVVRENGKFYIFIKEGNGFRKTVVDILAERNGLFHIGNASKFAEKEAVTSGAYYLNAALMKTLGD